NDLHVTIDGSPALTPFGFGGWVAMTRGDHDMDVMMGDLVLTQDQVNPVMSALLIQGLEVTALHNHFFWEEPRVFFMHVHGHGKPMELARAVKPALDLMLGPPASLAGATAASPSPTRTKLDTAALDRVAGSTGERAGPVYKYTPGRDDLHVTEMGATINARMGLNTWAAFIGTDDSAMVAGDVAMVESEVTPVLRALRSHGLDVVAIHHHMTGTQPMIIFLHYWGKGPAAKLAEGFRAALNELGPQGRASTGRSTLR
ncbi:MAG TPA: DUF1259 domain-containing protein, partial [Armatimonadota bacterium]